jgi:SAM-dependent methyltransferase
VLIQISQGQVDLVLLPESSGKLWGRSMVEIEVAKGSQVIDDGGTYDWRDRKRKLSGKLIKKLRLVENVPGNAGKLDREFIIESHHHYYGRPWVEGRYIFELLVNEGLKPHHKVLDVGCGSGRLGIHLLRYLEPGHYFGIDVHRKSLEAFAEYEIFLHGLEEKNARLLWTDAFAADHFGVEFDWAIDIATTLHFAPPVLSQAFERIAKPLASGGIMLVCHPSPHLPPEELTAFGLKLEKSEKQKCEKLEGHDFEPYLDYIVLRKLRSDQDLSRISRSVEMAR